MTWIIILDRSNFHFFSHNKHIPKLQVQELSKAFTTYFTWKYFTVLLKLSVLLAQKHVQILPG